MAHPVRMIKALLSVCGIIGVSLLIAKHTPYKSLSTDSGDENSFVKSLHQSFEHAQINLVRTTLTSSQDDSATLIHEGKESHVISDSTSRVKLDVQTSFHVIDTEQGMMDLDALFRRLVIVTAVSNNHVAEVMGMIASAQKFMPETPIYVYNLGLNTMNYQKLSAMCNFRVRKLNFSDYPQHVKDLHIYSWKVIIMRESLTEFGAIFYGDASVRFTGSLRTLFPYLHLHHGYMCHIHGFDPKIRQKTVHQYFKTHADMYAELGVNRDVYYKSNKSAPHISAGRILMVNNSVIRERLLIPLYECAMRKQCIKPKGAKAGSHRFDASALAIIVYKNLRYEWTEQNNNVKEFDEIVEIKRITKDRDNVKYCRELPSGEKRKP